MPERRGERSAALRSRCRLRCKGEVSRPVSRAPESSSTMATVYGVRSASGDDPSEITRRSVRRFGAPHRTSPRRGGRARCGVGGRVDPRGSESPRVRRVGDPRSRRSGSGCPRGFGQCHVGCEFVEFATDGESGEEVAVASDHVRGRHVLGDEESAAGLVWRDFPVGREYVLAVEECLQNGAFATK